MTKDTPKNLGATSTVAQVPPGGTTTERLVLLVIGDGLVATHPLPPVGDVVIGRASECDIEIDHPTISRRHAVLRVGPPMTIEDLGSANGTRVRDTWLNPGQATPITPGEVLDLGTTMAIVQQRSKAQRPRRLWTHGYFEVRLEDECARAGRAGATFALAHLRCDPDTPTTAIQETLAETLRNGDVVGFYAPGEYEILLNDTKPPEAEHVVGRLVEQLRASGARVAVGIACFPQDGRDPDSLVSRAARAVRGEKPATPPPIVPEGAMAHLQRFVERIAVSNISVLILGETGVGKELLAETVHRLSPRVDKPFLRLNCAALSESLLESELFGHERGAFTGAVQAKLGLLETAQGGTVFLDEIGELPMSVQVKLLRVIETRLVMRVGGLKSRPIDMRFVAATNRDLETEITRGTFRQDLFFRLNGVSLVIPPLRQRVGEIEGLARGFATEACRQAGRPAPAISREATWMLQRYHWPGNIRELRNVIERAVLLCGDGPITPEHLPVEKMTAGMPQSGEPAPLGSSSPTPRPMIPTTLGPSTPTPRPARQPFSPDFEDVDANVTFIPGLGRAMPGMPGGSAVPVPPQAPSTSPGARPPAMTSSPPTRASAAAEDDELDQMRRQVREAERRRILTALERCAGNQTNAAKLLGISRRTLINKMEAFDIPRPRKSQID